MADTGRILEVLDEPDAMKGRGLTRSDMRRTRSLDVMSTVSGLGAWRLGNRRSEADLCLSAADTCRKRRDYTLLFIV